MANVEDIIISSQITSVKAYEMGEEAVLVYHPVRAVYKRDILFRKKKKIIPEYFQFPNLISSPLMSRKDVHEIEEFIFHPDDPNKVVKAPKIVVEDVKNRHTFYYESNEGMEEKYDLIYNSLLKHGLNFLVFNVEKNY